MNKEIVLNCIDELVEQLRFAELENDLRLIEHITDLLIIYEEKLIELEN